MLLTVWPVISITVRLSEVVVTTAPVLHAFLVFIVRDFMHSAKEDTWDSGRNCSVQLWMFWCHQMVFPVFGRESRLELELEVLSCSSFGDVDKTPFTLYTSVYPPLLPLSYRYLLVYPNTLLPLLLLTNTPLVSVWPIEIEITQHEYSSPGGVGVKIVTRNTFGA